MLLDSTYDECAMPRAPKSIFCRPARGLSAENDRVIRHDLAISGFSLGNDLDRRHAAVGNALGRPVRDAEAAVNVAAAGKDDDAAEPALLEETRGAVGHVFVP